MSLRSFQSIIFAFLIHLIAIQALANDKTRFAFIIANNNGPEHLPALKYAENDAQSIYNTLRQLGKFKTENMQLLLGKDVKSIRTQLKQMQRRIQVYTKNNPRKKIDFLVYYSGHSSKQGLQINGSLLPIQEFKTLIRKTRADVKIAIVDACQSGTLTASKGGKAIEPFLIDVEKNSNIKGEIFISSSTALENSHESSEVKGSFFTHYFITALRGDADFNRDGMISLNEAYRYSYDHTLAKTAKLNLGLQHPTYQYSLSGRGEVILTSLANKVSYLILPSGDAGKYFIYNQKGGHIVSEVEKQRGETKKISLGSGKYIIRKLDKGLLTQKKVRLPYQGAHRLNWDNSVLLSDKRRGRHRKSDQKRHLSYENYRVSKKQKNSQIKKVTIPQGEPIRLRLLETLNSKKVNVGDKVLFEVLSDLKIEDRTVLSAGSLAIGEIIYTKKRIGLARGEMALGLRHVKSVDGRYVPLTSVIGRRGKGHSDDPNFARYSQHYRHQDHNFFDNSYRYNVNPLRGETVDRKEAISNMVSLGLAIGISSALWGKNAKMKRGTIITAFVAADTTVTVQ